MSTSASKIQEELNACMARAKSLQAELDATQARIEETRASLSEFGLDNDEVEFCIAHRFPAQYATKCNNSCTADELLRHIDSVGTSMTDLRKATGLEAHQIRPGLAALRAAGRIEAFGQKRGVMYKLLCKPTEE